MKNATHYSRNRQLVHADYCVRTQTVQYDRVRRVLNRPVVFNESHHRRKVKSLVLLLFQWNALSLCDELVARDLIGCNT